MTNEWNEFKAYTDFPVYELPKGRTSDFLGRFTYKMILDNVGFARIFTILARGYLFHDPDGTPKAGNAYDRIEYARRALCSWCSIPEKNYDKKKTIPREEWQYTTDFSTYHDEFPELVSEDGGGWYYRHVHRIADFVNANRGRVSKSTWKIADSIEGFNTAWCNKVKQYQVPLFAQNTKGDFILRFDDVIADALELGALRMESYALTPEQKAWVKSVTPSDIPIKITETLAEYYFVSKTENSDWVQMPQINLEAYFGSTSLAKQYLWRLPKAFMERKDERFGVCMYRVGWV